MYAPEAKYKYRKIHAPFQQGITDGDLDMCHQCNSKPRNEDCLEKIKNTIINDWSHKYIHLFLRVLQGQGYRTD